MPSPACRIFKRYLRILFLLYSSIFFSCFLDESVNSTFITKLLCYTFERICFFFSCFYFLPLIHCIVDVLEFIRVFFKKYILEKSCATPTSRRLSLVKQFRMVSGWLAFHEEEAYKAWNQAVKGEHFDTIKPM